MGLVSIDTAHHLHMFYLLFVRAGEVCVRSFLDFLLGCLFSHCWDQMTNDKRIKEEMGFFSGLQFEGILSILVGDARW